MVYHAGPQGPGGKVAVFETSKAGRLPDGVIPSVINGATTLDMAFDPFHTSRLLCGLEDGTVKVWTIPEGGLTEQVSLLHLLHLLHLILHLPLLLPSPQVNEPTAEISAHADKVSLIKFHPTAEGVLATASYDRWQSNHVILYHTIPYCT